MTHQRGRREGGKQALKQRGRTRGAKKIGEINLLDNWGREGKRAKETTRATPRDGSYPGTNGEGDCS